MLNLNMHAFRDSVHLSRKLIFSNNCPEDRDEVGGGMMRECLEDAYQEKLSSENCRRQTIF